MKSTILTLVTFLSFVSVAARAESNCSCNGLPGNYPGAGLFQKSSWGTSCLKLFPLNSEKDPMLECEKLYDQLVTLGICTDKLLINGK